MKITHWVLRSLLYLFAVSILLSRAATAVVSHDENQFIAAGQLLAYQGLLPYRDFPFVHMPYAVPLYAFTAAISPYDYLAARLLGVLTWLGCMLLVGSLARLMGRRWITALPQAAWAALLGEFALVLIFLYDPDSIYVLGAALNHSFATLFALLALYWMFRGVGQLTSLPKAAFWSGVFISIAALLRLNFASLVVILPGLWVLALLAEGRTTLWRSMGALLAGILLAALPAIALLGLAPARMYYGNIVYISLNTLYYRGILFRQTMDLPSKIQTYLGGLIHTPINLLLQLLALSGGIFFIVRFARQRGKEDFMGLSAAAFAGALFLSAFSPTPTQAHYFFAPLPFILLIVAVLGWKLYPPLHLASQSVALGLLAVLLLTANVPNPAGQWAALAKPSDWPPVQVHAWAESLHQYVPQGRMLSLLPMITMEGGYDAYSFTSVGAFSWRTSLLLSPGRRLLYGVTSPEELPALLDAEPPAGILTGFEAGNAGFKFGDMGGLETPFIDYARQHHYTPISLSPGFLGQTIILWVKQPQ